MPDTWTVLPELPNCQTCTQDPPAKAYADGKTSMGPWAYMCRTCFGMYGIGLGVGKGQELLTEPPPPRIV